MIGMLLMGTEATRVLDWVKKQRSRAGSPARSEYKLAKETAEAESSGSEESSSSIEEEKGRPSTV